MSTVGSRRSEPVVAGRGEPRERPEFAAKQGGDPPELPEFAAKQGGDPPELPEFAAKQIPAFVRWLDLVALAVALPIFIAADLPMPGYLTAAGAWLAQRAVQIAIMRRGAGAEDPRTIVGLAAGSMLARGWLVALSIFLVGLSDNDAGLAAAVLVIALFTIYLSVQMALHPFEAQKRARQ